MSVRRQFGKVFIGLTALLCLTTAIAVTSLAEEPVSASIMRISASEGTLEVEGPGGKKLPVIDNMRLHSGYVLETGQNSYAGLMLDETKAVRMDALSRASVKKQGKKLELLLSEGSLLCDVRKPLSGEETLNIRTSTTITGIRGTVLYVRVIDEHTCVICVLEGEVHIRAMDPDTGEIAEAVIRAGQQALAVTGAGAAQRAFADIRISQLPQEEIDGYVLALIAQDTQLAERLRAVGWDVDWMISNSERRLLEDQDEAAVRLKRLEDSRQENGKNMIDQMYMDTVSDTDSNSGSGQTAGRGVIYLTLPVDAGELDRLLKTNDVVVRPGAGGAPQELTIDQYVTVPSGGNLTVLEGITVKVAAGSTLQIDGTLTNYGSLNNLGTIRNTSRHTLDIRGDYKAEGGILINTGRMVVGGKLEIDSGKLDNQGGELEVEGEVILKNGSDFLTKSSTVLVHGSLTFLDSRCTLYEGTYENGIIVESTSLDDTIFSLNGAKVYSGDKSYAIEVRSDKDVLLDRGIVYAERGATAAVKLNGGKLYVKGNVLKLADQNIKFGDGYMMVDHNQNYYHFNLGNQPPSHEVDGVWEIDYGGLSSSRNRERMLSMLNMNTLPLSTSSNAAVPKDTGMEEIQGDADAVDSVPLSTSSNAALPEDTDQEEMLVDEEDDSSDGKLLEEENGDLKDNQAGEEKGASEDQSGGKENGALEGQPSGKENGASEEQPSGKENGASENDQSGKENGASEDDQSGKENGASEDDQSGKENGASEDDLPGKENVALEDQPAGKENGALEEQLLGKENGDQEEQLSGKESGDPEGADM